MTHPVDSVKIIYFPHTQLIEGTLAAPSCME